jgi:hypothetical protein
MAAENERLIEEERKRRKRNQKITEMVSIPATITFANQVGPV